MMMSIAHSAISPVSGSRQWSRSMPVRSPSGAKTKPTPSRPATSRYRSARSRLDHVFGSVEEALRAVSTE